MECGGEALDGQVGARWECNWDCRIDPSWESLETAAQWLVSFLALPPSLSFFPRLILPPPFQYTIQAIWTAGFHKIPALFLILNNKQYRVLKQRTYNLKGVSFETDKFVAMDLPNIDFPKLAESLGVKGVRATSLKEVEGHVKDWLKDRSGPVLLDVEIETGFKPQ